MQARLAWLLVFGTCAALAAQVPGSVVAVGGTDRSIQIAWDQDSPVRLVAATQNPDRAALTLTIRNDSATAVESIEVALVAHEAGRLRILRRAAVKVVPVVLGTVNDVAIDTRNVQAPATSELELGVTAVTYFEARRWSQDVVAQKGFAKLQPDSPLLISKAQVTPASFHTEVRRFNSAGCINPKPIRTADPNYTSPAKSHSVQGDVHIDALVDEKGHVTDIVVAKSLDPIYGLDAIAAQTARRWIFAPATCNGIPAAMVVSISITFRLH